MKTIWKYKIPINDDIHEIRIPLNAKILKVDHQDNPQIIVMWAEVTDNAPRIIKHYRVFGTGHEIPNDSLWMGTCQIGKFVWHLYELLWMGIET